MHVTGRRARSLRTIRELPMRPKRFILLGSAIVLLMVALLVSQARQTGLSTPTNFAGPSSVTRDSSRSDPRGHVAYTLTRDNVVIAEGFDTCAAPSQSLMNTWWNSSPYYFIGIYAGGENIGCPQPNLTASWVTTNINLGWMMLFLWPGNESECWTGGAGGGPGPDPISPNTSTAYDQGETAANHAAAAADNLGFSSGTIYYDLEPFGGTSACIASAQSFINGWDYQMDQNTVYVGGLYGSSEGSYLADFASIDNPPLSIDGADWDNNPDPSVMAGVPSGDWPGNERIKQFLGNYYRDWGGAGSGMEIDGDCSQADIMGPHAYDHPCS